MLPSNNASPSLLCLNINYPQSKGPVTSAARGAPQACAGQVMEESILTHFTGWKYRDTIQKNPFCFQEHYIHPLKQES